MGVKEEVGKEEKKREEKPAEEIGVPEIVKKIPEKIAEEAKKIKEKITEGIVPSAPSAEAEKPSVPEGAAPAEKEIVTVPPEERAPEEGLAPLLLASLGIMRETAWMSIIAIFCLIGLVIIGIREWELARKKKKN